jgi:hypothetical protein
MQQRISRNSVHYSRAPVTSWPASEYAHQCFVRMTNHPLAAALSNIVQKFPKASAVKSLPCLDTLESEHCSKAQQTTKRQLELKHNHTQNFHTDIGFQL